MKNNELRKTGIALILGLAITCFWPEELTAAKTLEHIVILSTGMYACVAAFEMQIMEIRAWRRQQAREKKRAKWPAKKFEDTRIIRTV